MIVAAGALQSPQLLQLSASGRRALLQSFGIPVVHRAAPASARICRTTCRRASIFRCTKPITTNDMLNSWWRTLAMGAAVRADARRARWRSASTRAACSRAPIPRFRRPDVQFHVATLSSDMAGSPVHAFSGFTMSVCQLQPESRGYVRVEVAGSARGAGDAAATTCRPTHDRATLVAGIRLARRLAATRALSPYVAGEYLPGPDATTDDDLLEFARNKGATIFHPSGTCKMGPAADPLAVVDAELRVHGVAGLRVVDCSIMPTLVSGNTNAPVDDDRREGRRHDPAPTPA